MDFAPGPASASSKIASRNAIPQNTTSAAHHQARPQPAVPPRQPAHLPVHSMLLQPDRSNVYTDPYRSSIANRRPQPHAPAAPRLPSTTIYTSASNNNDDHDNDTSHPRARKPRKPSKLSQEVFFSPPPSRDAQQHPHHQTPHPQLHLDPIREVSELTTDHGFRAPAPPRISRSAAAAAGRTMNGPSGFQPGQQGRQQQQQPPAQRATPAPANIGGGGGGGGGGGIGGASHQPQQNAGNRGGFGAVSRGKAPAGRGGAQQQQNVQRGGYGGQQPQHPQTLGKNGAQNQGQSQGQNQNQNQSFGQNKRAHANDEPIDIELTDAQVRELSKTFGIFDFDRDGVIDHGEFALAVKSIDIELEKAEVFELIVNYGVEMQRRVETSIRLPVKRGITEEGWFNAVGPRVAMRDPGEDALRSFNYIDYEQKGFLNAEDIRRVADRVSTIDQHIDDPELEAMIDAADLDGDGIISQEEFLDMCFE